MSEMNNMSKLPIPNWVRDRDRSLDENFCPECPHTFYSHIAYPHAGGCHRCPCTRTYESLVGEQVAGLMVEKATDSIPGITKPTGIEDGNTKPTAVDEPELQLLVLDMGDCCVVRVEQGEIDLPPYLSSHTAHDDGVPVVVDVPFTELRSAIDGEKPVPRIESESGGGHELHFLGANDVPCTTYIGGNAQKALESLFGKPLPIYEAGKWERLNTHDWSQAKKDASEIGYGIDTFSYENTICPVKIWRFTR